jgi:ATF/CREB family transcription factor
MQPHLHERKPDDNTQSVHDRPPKPRQPSDPFGHDPAHNAANGLYLLANQIPEGYQQAAPIHGVPTSNPGGSLDSSPNLAKRAAVNSAAHSGHAPNRSISGSSVSNTVRGVSEMSENMSDSSQEKETPARKRNAKSKAGAASTGKRKNDEAPKSASKKSKAAPKSQASDDGMDGDENEDDLDENGEKKDTKKMTDEEKRRNFLERNRVAALKCRQRKKQWLANLQAKVEMYGTENDALNATVQQLREEIVSLKTLLLAHKDCPVARSNGVQLDIATMASNEYGQMPVMPYGSMGMPMQHHPHQPGPGQRRYS